MSDIVLDPKSALIVIDLQKDIISRPTVHPVAEVIKNASPLADAFHARNLPVALVNNVTLAIDPMTDMSADAHADSVSLLETLGA